MQGLIKNNYIFIISSTFLSYIVTLNILNFFNISFLSNDVVFLLFMIGLITLIKATINIKNRTIIIGSGIFSVLLSASFVIGSKINFNVEPYFYNFKFVDILSLSFLSIFFFFVISSLTNFICNNFITFFEKKVSLKFWLLVFIIIVISWIPYFLTYYPGNLSTDSYISIDQCMGIIPLCNHHPIMFTLFIKIFIKIGVALGNLNFGVACFSFVQILILAAICSYCVYWLNKKGVKNYMLIFATIYFAFNPIIAMFSITMWKDILFSGWMLLFILLLYDIVESNGKLLYSFKSLASIIIYSFLISFGRNNGFYIIITSFLILAIYFIKYYKVLIPVFLLTIISIALIQGPLYNLLGIKKGNFAESIGIPLQQIGYTVKTQGKISPKQLDFLNNLLPIETMKQVYNPSSSNYIKFNEKFNNQFLENNKTRFLEIWSEILFNNPVKYIKADLLQTLGYYHIGTVDYICVFRMSENRTYLYNTDYVNKFSNINLQNKVESLINYLRSLPIVNLLYSLSFMLWITLFYCLVMVVKKCFKYIIPVYPLLVLWGTMMIAAPIFCEFRYMYSFHLAIPFLLATIFREKNL